MRIRFLALSLMLLAAACGGTDAASTTAAATDAPASTAQPGGTPTTAAPVAAEGPIAPNFVTVLSDGSQFDFGAHDKPVYLVFWAEW